MHALCAFALLALVSAPALAAPLASDPPPSGLKEIWVISEDGKPAAEQLLTQTVQGLANRQAPRVWVRGKSMYGVVEEQLRREGVSLRDAASPWDLVKQFRSAIKGAVVCKVGTPSVNAATSLCGVLDGVAVDESLLDRAKAEGLAVLADAREMTDRQAMERYRSLYARGVAVEQAFDKPGNLRDFSVARKAFTYATGDQPFRTEVARVFGPQALIYGWGPDEYQFVSGVSAGNATTVPADWALNLSALDRLPAGKLRRPRRPAMRREDGVRYIAFVLSDGDNVQWMCGGFVGSTAFWDSPLRGRFPMTWEVSATLGEVAPRVLQHLYATAKDSDALVAGAGAPGYTYPHYQPDRAAIARQSAPFLRSSDLSILSVLNANDGTMQETAPLLDLPEVQGILYKDYAPYNRRNGEVYWRKGKPCVSYRYLLWEGLQSPEQVAKGMATLPATPLASEASYALVQVHAWSYGKSGGPLEAVRKTIELLPANTRVVTADQLIAMMKANLGARHADDQ